MTFHFKELFWRIFYLSMSFLLSFSFFFYYSQEFFYILSLSFIKFNKGLFIYTSLSEAFFSYLKVSFFLASLITFPSLIFHLYYFINPGLNKREASLLFNYILASLFFYVLSFFFVCVFFLPIFYEFFLEFQKGSPNTPIHLTFLTKIDEFIFFFFKTIVLVSIMFQLPGCLIMLIKLNFITLSFLLKKRKYIFLFSLIISSFITPPDIFSLLIITLPLYIGFELLIFFYFIYLEYSM